MKFRRNESASGAAISWSGRDSHNNHEEKPSETANGGHSPSQLINARIAALADWRGETLARIRKLIHEADPHVVETWKWRGVPV